MTEAPIMPQTRMSRGQLEVTVFSNADNDRLKSIPGRSWVGHSRKSAWLIPIDKKPIDMLRGLLPATSVPDEVWQILNRKGKWLADIEKARRGHSRIYWDTSWMPNITPYEHQECGFAVAATALEMSPGTGLWHDMGLGKTLTCLASIAHVWRRKIVEAVITNGPTNVTALVLCPASVIGVWPKAVDEHCNFPIRCIPLTGPVPKRAMTVLRSKLDPFAGVTLFVTNYDGIRKGALAEALCEIDIDVVIADEAQALKTASSAQSVSARRIASKSKKIASTGTPTDKLQDYFGIFRFLDPSVFGTSETAFIGHWFNTVQIPGVPKPKVLGLKPELHDEFMEKIHSVCHSAKKEDCLDLPSKIDTPVPVELEPKVMKMYMQLRDEAIAWLESGEVVVGQNILTRMGRGIQMTGGFVKDDAGVVHQVSSAKLDACVDLVHTVLEQESKLVIFCRHTAEIDAIREKLYKEYIVDIIDGRVPPGPRRDTVIQLFQEEDTQVLIVQEKAGGAGITLHAASTAIDYSRSPDLIPYLQKRDRIHRIGMGDKPATYLNLYVPGTLDDKILHEVLQEKRDVHEMTVHQWKKIL